MGNPYLLIYAPVLLLLVGWLAVRHVRSPAPGAASKRAVLAVLAGACLLGLAWPAAGVPALVVITGVGVCLVVYRDVTAPGDGPTR